MKSIEKFCKFWKLGGVILAQSLKKVLIFLLIISCFVNSESIVKAKSTLASQPWNPKFESTGYYECKNQDKGGKIHFHYGSLLQDIYFNPFNNTFGVCPFFDIEITPCSAASVRVNDGQFRIGFTPRSNLVDPDNPLTELKDSTLVTPVWYNQGITVTTPGDYNDVIFNNGHKKIGNSSKNHEGVVYLNCDDFADCVNKPSYLRDLDTTYVYNIIEGKKYVVTRHIITLGRIPQFQGISGYDVLRLDGSYKIGTNRTVNYSRCGSFNISDCLKEVSYVVSDNDTRPYEYQFDSRQHYVLGYNVDADVSTPGVLIEKTDFETYRPYVYRNGVYERDLVIENAIGENWASSTGNTEVVTFSKYGFSRRDREYLDAVVPIEELYTDRDSYIHVRGITYFGEKLYYYIRVPVPKWSITFHPNKPDISSSEVVGSMDDFTDLLVNKDYNLSKNKYSLTGWVFVGWNEEPDGTGQSYTDLGVINKSKPEDVDLYAQWRPIEYNVNIYPNKPADATGGIIKIK